VGYLEEPRSLLVRAQDDGKTVAVATACPLASASDIVAEAPPLFTAAGLDPAEFYYYAEILVDPAYRGRGIAKEIYRERERRARAWGYRRLCLAVVQRSPNHPLRPPDYQPPERIWIRDGFVKTDIRFAYRWPTIQSGGGVVEQDNLMAYWTKDL
jgi:GNAT superfamily N-acetyltransferase